MSFSVAAAQLVAEAVYELLSGVLESHGIDHLLLKGPQLGAVVYDEAWQREYCDLDVLVRSSRFDEAIAALVANGFTLKTGRADRAATTAAAYDRTLVAPQGWLVELHRGFSPYGVYRVDYEALFARAVPFRFGRVTARGLSPEDLLLHLVIHAAKSQFRLIEPKHVRDVALLVERLPIRWEQFLGVAQEAGCRTAAWVFLTAAVNIHGARVPESVLVRIRPAFPRRRWLGLWLTPDRFPLLRWKASPRWLRRMLVAPAIVDGFWHGLASALQFGAVRLRDRMAWPRGSR